MQPKVIGILESRTGAHLADLIARRGGVPMLAPALEEIPDVDEAALGRLLANWRQEPFATVIFQTGVGTRALFAATDRARATDEFMSLLAAARVVVRGPKPAVELNTRRVRIDIRAGSPYTTETVIAALSAVPLQGSKVLVQRFGTANESLCGQLRERGAAVLEIASYKWALPADTQPLLDLLHALQEGRVDALLFTSAVQMHNLHTLAEQSGKGNALAGALRGIVIGSIGPVCSRALQQYGVIPTFEADPPKLGPLLAALEARFSDDVSAPR